MDINLWLTAIIHQRGIKCDKLVYEVTQQKHHALVFVFLLIDFVNQLLIFAKDLIQLVLSTLLLSLIIQYSFLEELGEVRLIKIHVIGSLSWLWLGVLALSYLFLEHLYLSFVLLDDSIAEMGSLGQLILYFSMLFKLNFKNFHLLLHLCILVNQLFDVLGLVF